MSDLIATLIDVGWGDSILLECEDSSGTNHYGLIDSNDTATLRSSCIFLKRFFERKKITLPAAKRVFDWVLLTHAHADHGQGLKRILKEFGTDRFWYPESAHNPVFFADLLRYAAKPQNKRVGQCDVIDTNTLPPSLGNASLDVLWPTQGLKPPNENNNSVVLTVTLGNVCFVFTGDAEADVVWAKIATKIPNNTRFFKVPHHGSHNGTFDSLGQTPWLHNLPHNAKVAISSHIRPFRHPSAQVVSALQPFGLTYRTDEHYHLRVKTDGQTVEVTYSHV